MSDPIYIHPAEARRRFREFADEEIDAGNLARGALLIALEDYPQMDPNAYLQRLEDIVLRTKARISSGDPAPFMVGHLQAEMFDTDGYHGDAANYYDPRNAYLNEVIDKKSGLPIMLSIIFLHVAHHVGLDAVGVGLPGHYLVKVRCELNEIYLDPFQGGETLTVREIGELLSQMSGGKVALKSEHLKGWDARETLIRVLANLQGMHTRAGDPRKAKAAEERIEILKVAVRGN